MSDLFQLILTNLINTSLSMVLFLCAYFANMFFSLYYNTKQLKQSFDKEKFVDGIYKVIAVALGLVLLVIVITSLPLFATYIGWSIPEEYVEVFNCIVIIGVCLVSSCKYIAEAFKKFSLIFSESKEEN